VVDYDDPSKNKVMIPTDKIDEFGVKHLVLSFVNAGEIDQAFSALRLCQFLTDKSCTEAFEIIERAKEKQEKGDGEKKAQMS
jgi:RNA polymerase-interacting CarD/CdnL/TRCF family regulator